MGFLSGLLERVSGEETVDYTHLYLDDGTPPRFAQADREYVRVWLRSARILDVRRWSAKFHAAVHGQFAYADRSAGQGEVECVVAPAQSFADLDPTHLDRFVTVNRPLLGPIPYRGRLAMDVALFSVSGDDLAKPYLDLLASLTDTGSVAFLAQARTFLAPLRRGAEALLGDASRAQLEIGLSRADTELRLGNLLVARAPKGTFESGSLRLDPHDYRLIGEDGEPVTAFPYMVIGIEASPVREDYAALPDVRSGWEDVRRAAADGLPPEEVRARFDRLRRAIWLSPDLIQTDKRRIVETFGREIAEAGYDLAPPAELAALEGMPQVRPLRDAELVLEPLAAAGAAEGAFEAAAAPERISMAELQAMMTDPDTPESELKRYFVANPENTRPFAPSIIPDPARVEVAPPSDTLEGAMMMDWANGLCRVRRQLKFKSRRNRGDRRMVLVSEGDSWYQFPLFLEDVIDQCFGSFNIWSVDAAGDTLQNMVLDNAEYMQALRAYGDEVRAFLFSGGGNDLVGSDNDGRSVLAQVLKPFEPGRPAEWYADTDAFAAKLRFVEDCYRQVLTNVATEFPGLPVICHGYDHAVPGGFPGDPRSPFWAKKDQWIGRPMREDLGITDPVLQREIVRIMIDRLNERLALLCGGNNPGGSFRHAWHVDVRGVVGDRWADELHPTDAGFRTVAARFLRILGDAIGSEAMAEALAEAEEGPDLVSPNAGDDAEVDPEDRAPVWDLGPFEAAIPWRVAEALKQLKRQVDAKAPRRRKESDGTIGDRDHENRSSDHNPWVLEGGKGVVTAMDITHDPTGGCDAGALAEAIRASRDKRVKYVIWNRRILSSTVSPWQWRPYRGRNPHSHHVHISVRSDKGSYDSAAEWGI